MARRAAKRRGQSRRTRERGGREWVGGRLVPPFFVTDRDQPYRPDLVVWLDAGDGLVVGQDVVEPEAAEGAVGRVLGAAIAEPLAGPPRRPDRVRVADAALVAEIRSVLGEATPVEVAPTPELDELLELMLASMSNDDDEEGSYLEDGRVSPDSVAEFFSAAESLYELAPWKVATDDRVLRMDIPGLGVEGACVAIIGNLDESLGLLIFPSLDAYEAFGPAVDRVTPGRGPIDLGSDWTALTFERGADLPPDMRREVAAHGWPVADANAYPVVECFERDGASRPLVERDLRIVSACAAALAPFFEKHRRLFEARAIDPVCESWFIDDELEVCFTLPYEAYVVFDVGGAPPAAPAARPKVGRNDPCPCGSGKKYKKCHLAADEAADEAERAERREAAEEHGLDGDLTVELGGYALARFGFEWRRFSEDFADPAGSLQLAGPWSLYHYRVQGRTVLEWYLEDHGPELPRADRAWLRAQQAAWLSVWEVLDVEPGESVTLRDLLSHEERRVREARGSRTLVPRDALLARVVDHEGVSLLCGTHPQRLPPLEAAEVVRRARGRLRRKRAVPVERLREEAFGRYLIRRWEEALAVLRAQAEIPLDLRNSDGDAFLFTTDHFEFAPGERAEVGRLLAAIDGVERDDSDEDEVAYVFLEPGNARHASWENTIVGQAVLSAAGLHLETNSRERADALRARVEAACGDRLRHRAREHADPLSEAAGDPSADRAAEPVSPEVEQLLLEFKRRHYADWLDQPLPALGGHSPRETACTAQGRNAVDALLKDMENFEHRSSGQAAFDFVELRRELGLE